MTMLEFPILEYLVYSELAGVYAIGDADAAISIARQRETRVALKAGINAFEQLWVTEIVLGHGIFPHEHSREQRLGLNAKCAAQFVSGKLEQFCFVPGDGLPGAADEYAQQGRPLRRAVWELG